MRVHFGTSIVTVCPYLFVYVPAGGSSALSTLSGAPLLTHPLLNSLLLNPLRLEEVAELLWRWNSAVQIELHHELVVHLPALRLAPLMMGSAYCHRQPPLVLARVR